MVNEEFVLLIGLTGVPRILSTAAMWRRELRPESMCLSVMILLGAHNAAIRGEVVASENDFGGQMFGRDLQP